MLIREAKLKDAQGIAKVHVESWKMTYKGILSNDFLNTLSTDRRAELWRENLLNNANHILVAENEEGTIIGFAAANQNEESAEEYSGKITSIYLLEEYQNKGIGKKLLQYLFRYFKEMNWKKIFVEVLEDNSTRYFYKYFGAKLVKTMQIKIGDDTLNELIYKWSNVDTALNQLEA